MRFISPQFHRILDYVTIVVFALAPRFIGLTGLAATISYALAVVHLAVTLVTQVPAAAPRPLPFKAHGALETLVGIVLVLLPFLLGWAGPDRVFYIAAGAVILIVSLTTSHGAGHPAAA